MPHGKSELNWPGIANQLDWRHIYRLTSGLCHTNNCPHVIISFAMLGAVADKCYYVATKMVSGYFIYAYFRNGYCWLHISILIRAYYNWCIYMRCLVLPIHMGECKNAKPLITTFRFAQRESSTNVMSMSMHTPSEPTHYGLCVCSMEPAHKSCEHTLVPDGRLIQLLLANACTIRLIEYSGASSVVWNEHGNFLMKRWTMRLSIY